MSSLGNQDLMVSELKKNQSEKRVTMVQQNQPKKKEAGQGNAFANYNLMPEIVKAIKSKGYNMPTPIQRRAIPAIM